MKIKVRNVYYCDFCKKHSLRPLTEHEKHCTANPNRICRLCGRTNYEKLITKYKDENILPIRKTEEMGESYYSGEEAAKFNKKIIELYDETDNCPICTLTVIRCTILERYRWLIRWDYKKEMEKYWKEKNAEHTEY